MPRNARAPLVASLACLGALGLLALLVHSAGAVQHRDAALLVRLVAAPGSHTEALANDVALLGDAGALLLFLSIACGIALARQRTPDALAAIVVLAGANLTTQVLKVALAHPRFQLILGADQLAWNSFPSGHVTAAASAAVALALVVPARLRAATALFGGCLVVAVGWSVLALAWHYPSDVLGGILVAATWGFAALGVQRVFAVMKPQRVTAGSYRSNEAAISTK